MAGKTTKSGDKSLEKNLVIVESPAKARTIKKFLGKNFEVTASMGHIEDLPKKELGIDIENGFEATYQISPDKKKIVGELRKQSKNFDKIWLATDEDREGEAIAWHILRVLKLKVEDTPRIVFHEITKDAIEKAVKSPKIVDMQLVDAQKGRRILDRLVGFKASPLLWQKIKRGLSAGRVQSVAVKLIVEREREIDAFIPVESWKLKAELKYKTHKIEVELIKIKSKAAKIEDVKGLEKILQDLGLNISDFENSKDKKTGNELLKLKKEFEFELVNIIKKETKKNPSPPFITSTLQQEASRRFGWGVKQVMQVAQKLYENGHITYMRTDSVNLSGLAINAAQKYIESNFGKEYGQVRQYKSKGGAQEAHEAIRPSYIDKSPEKSGLKDQELKLYGLIWARTVASQMAQAIFDTTQYDFNPLLAKHQTWIAKGEVLKFDGFLKLYKKEEENGESKDDIKQLPEVKQGEILKSQLLIGQQNFTKPPARYTEASLVKKLESLGIGRPSTYAPTINTIQQRTYVIKEEKKLKPTEIAFIVTDYLEEFFKKLMDYKFTAGMEVELDKIADGKLSKVKMLEKFYKDFAKDLEKGGYAEKKVMKVGKNCPDCGGELIFRFSSSGKFIGCDNYPDCKYTEQGEEKNEQLEALKAKFEGQPCEAGGTIVVKVGRFGPFLASSEYPKVKRIKGIPDEKKEALQEKFGGEKCDKCGEGTMMVKKSKRGYFLACNKYPECKNAKNIKENTKDK